MILKKPLLAKSVRRSSLCGLRLRRDQIIVRSPAWSDACLPQCSFVCRGALRRSQYLRLRGAGLSALDDPGRAIPAAAEGGGDGLRRRLDREPHGPEVHGPEVP